MGSGETEGEDTNDDPGAFARERSFWIVLGSALVLGVVGAAAGLVFLTITEQGERWLGEDATGWFEGPPWIVAVTAGAGLAVGLLRRAFRMPTRQPGLIEEIRTGEVEPRRVPGTVAVSAASLVGGASLGPEMALGAMGGGAGAWMSRRAGLDDETRRANTLNGMSGAYGGMFSSPILATLLVLELARAGGRRFLKLLIGGSLAAAVSFAIYFPITGTLFLEAYALPSYGFEDWHLLAAVGLGAVAGVIAIVLGIAVGLTRRLLQPLERHTVVRPVVGGVVFGLIAIALPLTLFTGSDQLGTIVDDRVDVSVGLLIALVLGKIVTFAVATNTGFIGGPVFPALFVGGAAGLAAAAIVPGLPAGLAFTCVLAAVPGALVAAPFTMVLLAGLLVGVGALNLGPILIAVLVAYMLVSGSGVVEALARRSGRRSPGAPRLVPPASSHRAERR